MGAQRVFMASRFWDATIAEPARVTDMSRAFSLVALLREERDAPRD
jgi:hypothetical protein